MPDPEIIDDDDKKDVKPKKEKGDKLVLIIVLVVALLFFAGAGVGVFLLLNSAGQSTAPQTQTQEQARPSPSELGVFYNFERPIIVNLAGTNAERYLKIEITLEIDHSRTAREIDNRLPHVMDLLITISSSKNLDDISTISGKNMFRQEIIDRLNMLLPSGKIRNVYFTEFVVQ